MKRKIIYDIGLVLLMVLSTSCGGDNFNLPPLKETYSQNDKNPFGAFVLHHQLQQFYYNNSLQNVKAGFEYTWRDISDTASLYINISKNLFLTYEDLKAMLACVNKGNSIFISSENIDRQLLDTLGCKVSRPFFERSFTEMKYTAVQLSRDVFNDSLSYQYFYLPFISHFIKPGTTSSKVLGSNSTGANFILVTYGKGRFFLHLEPRAMSNYFLLQKENYKYLQHIFSVTAAVPEHIYWDDFYNKRSRRGDKSGNRGDLDVLLQYPSTAWAFWLLLVLTGLYIFFGGKRRQRIVETIPHSANTTLKFTETIGRLYLQQKDNRNIADKIITYLLEHIRNQYYLNTSHFSDEFIATLSRKTDNTKEGTEKLFQSITAIQQSAEVSDEQLLVLNQQVENFYKNKI